MAKFVLTAEKDIQEIFYGGEKLPHLWWDKFEVKLTNAFEVIDKNVDHQFHTVVKKLRILNSKIRYEFPVSMKTNKEMQMNMQPMVMKFTSTLSNYLNTVNQRHPNENNLNNNQRRIQTLAGRGGKGSGGVRGTGRSG